MINIIALVLLAIFSLYYIYFVTRVQIGLLFLRKAQKREYCPFVTVIVAARNEEDCIGQCLQTLVQQTYPSDKYEIIIVDDASTDGTSSIVKSFSEKYKSINLISLTSSNENRIGQKPFALSKGIEQSKGEIILTTDADCIVPNRWIEIMSNHFEDDVVFVAGPVVENGSDTFFSKLEQLEFLSLITTAAGLIGAGQPIICNGANLAYRKKTFKMVRGFSDNYTSNDDEYLMNKIVRNKIGKVVFSPEAESAVLTRPSNTIRSFLKQRIRWAKKQGHYKDKKIFIKLVSLYMFFLSMFINAILIFVDLQFALPFLIAFTGKIIIDYFTLHSGAKLFRQHIRFFYFLVAELLHVPYIVTIAAVGQFAPIRWKDRNISH